MLHHSTYPAQFAFIAATATALLIASAPQVFADPASPSRTATIPGSPECTHLRNDDAKFGEYADCEFNASVRRTREYERATEAARREISLDKKDIAASDRQIYCGKYLKALIANGVIYPKTGEVITKVTVNRLAPGGKITPDNLCEAAIPFAGLMKFSP